MGGEDDGAVIRAFVEFLDEDGAHRLKALNNMRVVDDLVPHEDRGAPLGEGLFDDLDRPVHPGAKAPRGRQEDLERGAG